jgi:hypothetical protein
MDISAGIIAREGIDSHNLLWNLSLYKNCPWMPEVIHISMHQVHGRMCTAGSITFVRDDSGAAIGLKMRNEFSAIVQNASLRVQHDRLNNPHSH